MSILVAILPVNHWRDKLMTPFDDARNLVEHCARRLESLRELHDQCLRQRAVAPLILVEVKNLMENLRSALDYAAAALFGNYGSSRRPNPNIYFPYANEGTDRKKFRDEIVERSIPGLLASRPDIVDRLETYQWFGNTGNWLPVLAKLVNENKHSRLTPQVQKQYKVAKVTATIPAGETVEIDLRKLAFGAPPDEPVRAFAGTWAGLVFHGTHVPLVPFLENSVQNVRRVVDELSGL